MQQEERGERLLRAYAWLTGAALGGVDGVVAARLLPAWNGGAPLRDCIAVALAVSVPGIAAALAAPALASWAGRRPVNTAAAALLLVGAGTGAAPAPWAPPLGLGLLGAGHALAWVVLPRRAHELSLRGHARLVPQATALVGAGGAAGIGAACATGMSAQGPLALVGACAAALLVVSAVLPESPLWYVIRGEEEKAFLALRRLHGLLEAAIAIDWVRLEAQMGAEQRPLRARDLAIPQVRASMATAAVLLCAQEAPLAAAVVAYAPALVIRSGGSTAAVAVFAVAAAAVSAMALAVVRAVRAHRFLRVLLGCALAVAASTAGAALVELRAGAPAGAVVVGALVLAAQRCLTYPGCHGAIDPRVPPWLVEWQRRAVVLANVLARFAVLLVGTLLLAAPPMVAAGAYLALQCAALVVVLARLPRELRM